MGKISDKINDLLLTAFNGAKYSSAGGANDIQNYFIEFNSSLGDVDIEGDIEQIIKEQTKSSPQQSSDNNTNDNGTNGNGNGTNGNGSNGNGGGE